MTTVPAAPHGPTTTAGWLTAFSEPFAGSSLDLTKWFPGAVPNGGASVFTAGFNATGVPPTPAGNTAVNNPAMISVAGGICTLLCQAIPGAGTISAAPIVGGVSTVYNYECASMTTSPGAAGGGNPAGFLFNAATRTVYEVRAKLPAGGTGLWPAIWCSSSGLWKYEVDGMEAQGVGLATQPQQNIHFPAGGALTNNQQTGPNVATTADLSLAFHDFTTDMNYDGQGSVGFWIDGVLINTQKAPGYATAQMLLVINLALSSLTPTGLPASFQIARVAVYKEAPVSPPISTPTLDANSHVVPSSRDDVSVVFTAPQTAASLVHGRTHIFDASAGSITPQPLPYAPANGTTFPFKRLDTTTANVLTIFPGGTDTIEQGAFTHASANIEVGRTTTFVYNNGVWTVTGGNITTTGILAATLSSVTPGSAGTVPTIPNPNALAVSMDPTYGPVLYQNQGGTVVRVHGLAAVMLPEPSTAGADDALALNAAILAGSAGCEVNAPPGALYTIKTTVVLQPNRKYRFAHRWPANSSAPPTAGSSTFGIKVANAANLDYAVATPAVLQTGTGQFANNPIDIDSILIDGNKSNQTTGKGILLAVSGWRSIIGKFGLFNGRGHGLNVTGDTSDGHQMSGNAYENHIQDGTIDGCGGFGIWAPDITDSWIRDCVISNSGLTGISANGFEGWQIYGNHLWDCGLDGMNLQKWYAAGVHDNYIEGFGVAPGTAWAIGTTYDRYAVVTQASGIWYSTVEGNVGNTPASDGGVHWAPANPGNGSLYGIGAWAGGNARPMEIHDNHVSIGHVTLTIAPINYHCYCVQSGTSTGGNGLATGIGSYLSIHDNTALNEYPNGQAAPLSRAYKMQFQTGGALAVDGIAETPSGVGRNGIVGTFSSASTADASVTTWARQ
jgi:hypothetical protein